jgi:nascent polypeptide-associated complex subunit alpha
MMPGINPKQMKQMMKKLGMKMEPVEGVERIIIYTTQGNYIFEDAEVIATVMQGMTTYQINGEPRFEPAEMEISKEDVTLVMEQTGVPAEAAREALKKSGGDIAEAIIALTEQ